MHEAVLRLFTFQEGPFEFWVFPCSLFLHPPIFKLTLVGRGNAMLVTRAEGTGWVDTFERQQYQNIENFFICCLPKIIPLGFYPMDLSVVRSQTALWHFKERSSTNREIKVFLLCVNSNYYHGQNFRKNSSKRTKAVCKTKCYTFHQCLR